MGSVVDGVVVVPVEEEEEEDEDTNMEDRSNGTREEDNMNGELLSLTDEGVTVQSHLCM